MMNFKLDDRGIYQHLCLELKEYLNNQNSSETDLEFLQASINIHDSPKINQADYIPSYAELTKQFKYTTGTALIRMELWVELHLKLMDQSVITII